MTKADHKLIVFLMGQDWFWRCTCGASDLVRHRTRTAATREAKRLHAVGAV